MSASGHSSSIKAVFFAFAVNLAIAIAKTVGAIYTASGSMLAEAIHSYADTGNQVLLFFGLKQSQKPPDEDHPLGYGKVVIFGALSLPSCYLASADYFLSMRVGTSFIIQRYCIKHG